MTKEQIKRQVIGNKEAGEVFEKTWEAYDIKGAKTDGGKKVTTPLQKAVEVGSEKAKENKGMVREHMAKLQTPDSEKAGAMTDSQTEAHVPLVYDPEIVSILFQEAPILNVIPEEGQEGFKAVYNIVSDRENPVGFVSESDALDLTSEARDITFSKSEKDMQIYVDVADISDFTQEASNHYMNVQDTTLGERTALFAQRKEQQILYGEPGTTDIGIGYLTSSNSYKGLANIYAETDKSSISSSFARDIKQELNSLTQNNPVSKNNLTIMCSWNMYDTLENEMFGDNLRVDMGDDTVDIAPTNLRIGGVDVVPTHNITTHQTQETVQGDNQSSDEIHVTNNYTGVLSSGDTFDVAGTEYTVDSLNYDSNNNETEITVSGTVSTDHSGDTATLDVAGDDGDVFIINNQTARFRTLVPFSSVPLGRTGLSEQTALFEFGALIEKSEGNFGKYLKAYSI